MRGDEPFGSRWRNRETPTRQADHRFRYPAPRRQNMVNSLLMSVVEAPAGPSGGSQVRLLDPLSPRQKETIG